MGGGRGGERMRVPKRSGNRSGDRGEGRVYSVTFVTLSPSCPFAFPSLPRLPGCPSQQVIGTHRGVQRGSLGRSKHPKLEWKPQKEAGFAEAMGIGPGSPSEGPRRYLPWARGGHCCSCSKSVSPGKASRFLCVGFW